MFLSFGMPAVAQIANGVDFTTSFPFYAGNAKMPAGAYTITQPSAEDRHPCRLPPNHCPFPPPTFSNCLAGVGGRFLPGHSARIALAENY